MAVPANTIDEVLEELDAIIDEAIRDNHFTGIFAYLYRRTTFQIKCEIEKGTFEDNARMEEFDVVFANLYLNAFHNYRKSIDICDAWKISFEARNKKLTIMQHLLMGMNAHINYDLGIAASEFMKGKPMEDLHNDFHKINDILAQLIDEIQDRVERVSKLFFILDFLGGRADETIIRFSIRQSREHSWNIANELYGLPEEARIPRMEALDVAVRKKSEYIIQPRPYILNAALWAVRLFEEKNIGTVISRLREEDRKALK